LRFCWTFQLSVGYKVAIIEGEQLFFLEILISIDFL